MGTVCVSIYLCHLKLLLGFSGGSAIKESTCNAEDEGSIPGSRRYSGIGNDSPLQCSCLGHPMDRGIRWAVAHGVTKSGHSEASELTEMSH